MVKEQLQAFKLFLKSANFYRSIILTIAVVIPLSVLYIQPSFIFSVSISIGAFIVGISDIPGNLKHKLLSIISASVLGMFTTLFILLVKPNFQLLIATIAILSFGLSLLAVYGFRGSLIGFSGLIALVMALGLSSFQSDEIYFHVLFMGLGGLWYLLVSILFYKISPKKDEDQFLYDTLNLTGDYLKTRSKLLLADSNRQEHRNTLLVLESQLNEKHEALRELLLNNRKFKSRTKIDEKRLLLLMALVDSLELAIANGLDYDAFDSLFKDHQQVLIPFKNVNLVFGDYLHKLADVHFNGAKLPSKSSLIKVLSEAQESIQEYLKTHPLPDSRNAALLLTNLYDYQSAQLEELRTLRRILSDEKVAFKLEFTSKESQQFITQQEYSIKRITNNLTLKSPIFRHALRLSIALSLSYLFGHFIEIVNNYWIALTVIVIMRPNYGLTKSRSIHRIWGTLAGALVAVGIILITQNIYIYIGLAIISMMFAFALIQQNFRSSAAFITLTVVFVFALIEPNAFLIIQYRVIDTLIGVAFAFGCSYLLWPHWEVKNMNLLITEAIKGNIKYLNSTLLIYEDFKVHQTAFKVSRKDSFVAMSNLSSGIQRLAQDPKSKQQDFELFYEMVTLNQTTQSAIASLGQFIQNHKTSEVSKSFHIFIDFITHQLQEAVSALNHENNSELKTNSGLKLAEQELLEDYKTLVEIRNKELSHSDGKGKSSTLSKLQEAHLIYNQLVWLKNLSTSINHKSKSLSSSS
ncbi:MAG: hypothetical protein BM564_00325 [Bacteroidetes bacterium MedPE-SWsnd-G2]|nr:MAG: hypothetical protein BM564_00325 [Bacteroidetes bacterium MedPE-SWsnd-G2]